MKLVEFKKQFVDMVDKLEGGLDKIRDLLLSESEERESTEDYSQHGFKVFCAIAKEELSSLRESATKIYYYAVQDGFDPVNDDSISEQKALTPLCQDLDKLYDEINMINFCLGHSYNKLTNDHLECMEINWDADKDSAETFTNSLIQFLEEQIEATDYIISFIESSSEKRKK